jgi:hypothetical protein
MRQDISTSTAATGGVQAHSVGDIYPFLVIGRGDDSREIMDCRTGGCYRPTDPFDRADVYRLARQCRDYLPGHPGFGIARDGSLRI